MGSRAKRNRVGCMAAPEELAGLLALVRLERSAQHSCTPRWRSYGFCLMFWLGWLETAVAHRRAAGLPRRSRHVEKDHASADVVATVGAGPCGFPAGGGGHAHAIRAGPGAGGPPAGAAAGHEEAPGRRVDRPIVRYQPLPGASMLFCRAALPRSADNGGPGGLGGRFARFHAGGDHRAALFGLHLAPGRAAARAWSGSRRGLRR